MTETGFEETLAVRDERNKASKKRQAEFAAAKTAS
jgi:hypothetical protein